MLNNISFLALFVFLTPCWTTTSRHSFWRLLSPGQSDSGASVRLSILHIPHRYECRETSPCVVVLSSRYFVFYSYYPNVLCKVNIYQSHCEMKMKFCWLDHSYGSADPLFALLIVPYWCWWFLVVGVNVTDGSQWSFDGESQINRRIMGRENRRRDPFYLDLSLRKRFNIKVRKYGKV